MKIYLVGGAVRDQLMGRPVKEKDWVVIGATPDEMLAKGFRPVGKDFPVFLHPQTNEEYALARTERKSGKGYKGFVCYAAPDVSLEDDLKRRDLTINAMAQTMEGQIIDPYGGRADLKNKIMRHVSPAFVEDPLRVLRVARFAARYSDFAVHPETMQLMHDMAQSGELSELVPERVWVEMVKALSEAFAWRFFEVLQDCGALIKVLPEVVWHAATENHFKQVVKLTEDVVIRFAILMFNTDKQITSFCERLRVSANFQDLAELLIAMYTVYQDINIFAAEKLLDLLEKTDAFRKTERFKKFLVCCAVLDNSEEAKEKIKRLQLAFDVAAKVRFTPNEQEKKLTGLEIARWMHEKRCAMIRDALQK